MERWTHQHHADRATWYERFVEGLQGAQRGAIAAGKPQSIRGTMPLNVGSRTTSAKPLYTATGLFIHTLAYATVELAGV